MNKKLILAGIVVAAGFITLTAFGGKTREQQTQEIAAAVQARLDEFAAQKDEECTIKVNEEAQVRHQAYLATLQAEAAKPGSKTTKKKAGTGTKVAPLPQKVPTDPQKTRSGAAQPGDVEQQKKREGAAPTTTPAPAEQKKRPGAAGGGK
jgi:type II secretory pathway pseudopilin PulG